MLVIRYIWTRYVNQAYGIFKLGRSPSRQRSRTLTLKVPGIASSPSGCGSRVSSIIVYEPLNKAIITAILVYSVESVLAFVALLFQSVGWATGATIVINPCSQPALSFGNAIISSADEVSTDSNISTPGSCQSSATSSTDVCRVYGLVNTTVDSAVKFEIWEDVSSLLDCFWDGTERGLFLDNY